MGQRWGTPVCCVDTRQKLCTPEAAALWSWLLGSGPAAPSPAFSLPKPAIRPRSVVEFKKKSVFGT